MTEKEHSAQRRIPDFIVAGVGKAGTTSIYHYLDQHPSIFLPKIKETGFFAHPFINRSELRPSIRKAWIIDVDKFIEDGMPRQIHGALINEPDHYEALFKEAQNDQLTGEVCPVYFNYPDSLSRMKEKNPDIKGSLLHRHNPLRQPDAAKHRSHSLNQYSKVTRHSH